MHALCSISAVGVVLLVVSMTLGDHVGNLLKLLSDPAERELVRIAKQVRGT